jgi:hypothetical protein
MLAQAQDEHQIKKRDDTGNYHKTVKMRKKTAAQSQDRAAAHVRLIYCN